MTEYPAKLGLYIDGEWLSGEGRDTHRLLNPATGAGQADLPLATTADLDRALVAVRAVAYRPPDEGHADRPGDGAAVVVRAR